MTGIDMFAGAGGASEGGTQAGVKILWAGNHNPMAVEIHKSNHPSAHHICQDLHQANWAKVPAHDVMLASPCCQGHSKAKGKNTPEHDESRSTAWAPVSCAEFHRPEFFVIENVEEFMGWILFPVWKTAMEALGYCLSPHIIDSADHGVRQNRNRMFMVGSQSKNPIKLRLDRYRQPHKPVRDIIDFSNNQRWSKIDKPGRAKATLERVAAGRKQFGDRFVMPYYSSGSGKTGRSLDRPLGTVTTKDRWAVVDGDRMRMCNAREYAAAMGFREDYKLPYHNKTLTTHLVGNAVVPAVERDVLLALKEAA